MNSEYGTLELDLVIIVGGIIVLLSLFMPWVEYGGDVVSEGFNSSYSAATLFGSLLMIGGVLLGTDILWGSNATFMGLSMNGVLGFVGSVVGLAGVLSAYSEFSSYSVSWGLYVAIIGLIIGLVASVLVHLVGSIFGSSGRGRSSGGL